MITWLCRRWYARQRKIDIDILWPLLRTYARWDLKYARAAFSIHAHEDRAWLVLGSVEIDRIIGDLH